MINYNEIKEKYPKSFDALIDFMLDHERHSGDTGYEISKTGKLQSLHAYPEFHPNPICFYDRDLYDFFDGEGILICVEVEFDELDSHCLRVQIIDGCGFPIAIGGYNLKRCFVEIYYKNRIAAETAAFTKAFEILEERR